MSRSAALAFVAVLAIGGPALAQSAQPGAPAGSAQPATTEGVGQIRAVDARAGTITIHHGPIQTLGWPAMTMAFKATPEVLQSAKAGQAVRFTLQGPDNQVVGIKPQ